MFPCGLGDYLPRAVCPDPPIVQEWMQIPYAQIQGDMDAMGVDRLHCMQGLGALTMDGTGLFGTGLFSGGFDLSTWGIGEYLVAVVGGYMVLNLFSDIARGSKKVSRKVRSVRSKSKRKKRLQEELSEL